MSCRHNTKYNDTKPPRHCDDGRTGHTKTEDKHNHATKESPENHPTFTYGPPNTLCRNSRADYIGEPVDARAGDAKEDDDHI